MGDESGFYEDDEPVEKVRAAYERGKKGVTRPRDLNKRAADIVREATEPHDLPGVLLAAWDEHSLTLEGLEFGGHGLTTFARPTADSASIEGSAITVR